MKPENHAIRQLEKQLEGATPEIRAAMERVILALDACLMNSNDPAALKLAQAFLARDVAALDELLKSKK